MGGVLWTIVVAVVGILTWYQYGLGQVSVCGFFMHNAVGMWFTPMTLGIFYYAYYALPKLLSRRIYSVCLPLRYPGGKRSSVTLTVKQP